MKPPAATPGLPDFWRGLLSQPSAAGAATPFYAFSRVPLQSRLAELDAALTAGGWRPGGAAPRVRHWLSFKTQPLRSLIRWWQEQNRDVEVVSEFEFLAARAEGFPPERILINGPAKHRWLPRHALAGLRVHFDSPAELRALLPFAKKLRWRAGVRLLTAEEFDPEHPGSPTQFGFTPAEAVAALKQLRREKITTESLHLHLRTNVASHVIYERAVAEAASVCRQAGFAPRFLDMGGGVPPAGILSRGGKRLDAEFSPRSWAAMLRRAVKSFPSLEELWLENGRCLSASSGVLVVTVLDAKERRGQRQLLCDGGRTLHGLVSTWERHALHSLPARRGRTAFTVVHGPTCMAFDQLARLELPRSIRVGDRLVWMDAGAYHLPWETRFSHGLARVLWHDGSQWSTAREAEDFASWWNR